MWYAYGFWLCAFSYESVLSKSTGQSYQYSNIDGYQTTRNGDVLTVCAFLGDLLWIIRTWCLRAETKVARLSLGIYLVLLNLYMIHVLFPFPQSQSPSKTKDWLIVISFHLCDDLFIPYPLYNSTKCKSNWLRCSQSMFSVEEHSFQTTRDTNEDRCSYTVSSGFGVDIWPRFTPHNKVAICYTSVMPPGNVMTRITLFIAVQSLPSYKAIATGYILLNCW